MGGIADRPVDFTDVLPTLMDAAGVSIPSWLVVDGINFLSVDAPRRHVYSYYRHHVNGDDMTYARTRRYKLTASGDFFDVLNDPSESLPLLDLNISQLGVYSSLQRTLEYYEQQM
jgi:arylsulfatase A